VRRSFKSNYTMSRQCDATNGLIKLNRLALRITSIYVFNFIIRLYLVLLISIRLLNVTVRYNIFHQTNKVYDNFQKLDFEKMKRLFGSIYDKIFSHSIIKS
jgi:hypothetical protein